MAAANSASRIHRRLRRADGQEDWRSTPFRCPVSRARNLWRRWKTAAGRLGDRSYDPDTNLTSGASETGTRLQREDPAWRQLYSCVRRRALYGHRKLKWIISSRRQTSSIGRRADSGARDLTWQGSRVRRCCGQPQRFFYVLDRITGSFYRRPRSRNKTGTRLRQRPPDRTTNSIAATKVCDLPWQSRRHQLFQSSYSRAQGFLRQRLGEHPSHFCPHRSGVTRKVRATRRGGLPLHRRGIAGHARTAAAESEDGRRELWHRSGLRPQHGREMEYNRAT